MWILLYPAATPSSLRSIFPTVSLSFSLFVFIHFCINRLYDIIKNELNLISYLSGLVVINVIAVTYLLIKEHARVCQSAPCMFYFSRVSQILKMYKFSFFSIFYIYDFQTNIILFMPERGFTFLFVKGDWGTPQQAGLGTLYSYNVHQSPACYFLDFFEPIKSASPELGRK